MWIDLPADLTAARPQVQACEQRLRPLVHGGGLGKACLAWPAEETPTLNAANAVRGSSGNAWCGTRMTQQTDLTLALGNGRSMCSV